MNHRRKILITLGASAAALALPLGSFAQAPGKIWRVGVLTLRRTAMIDTDPFYVPFRDGMRVLGYVEGRNLKIEWRAADGDATRMAGLAAELVNLQVDVIVTSGTLASVTAQKATATIPIVIAHVSDPVGSSIVKSLARPGGNITGTSLMVTDVSAKHLEMLLGMAPKLTLVAVLMNPASPIHPDILKRMQEAALSLKVKLLPLQAGGKAEIDAAFATMARQKAGAVSVAQDPLFVQQARQIAQLAAQYRLPSITASGELAEAGGLLGYGANLGEQFRQAATFVDKIFKGAKPADLPVEQPTKFELVINGKTAKALGLKIPQALLISANKIIE